MANARYYSSIAAVTNLQATIASGDTSIQVASSVGFPGTFPFTLSLDYGSANEELVDVTAGGPSIFTVTRAVDGTSASSHNAGAVVRHTSSARDFTESRTHEASDTGVHGISGSFVDTVSAQTLANKTLTAPVVNAATLNGNIGGTGTFTSAFTFSGGPTFTTTLASFRNGSATGDVQGVSVTGDPFDRYRIDASGKMNWGSGSAARDSNLYRSGVNAIRTDGQMNALSGFQAVRSSASGLAFNSAVTGDVDSRYAVQADGTVSWGPGSGAADTNLYRSSANNLKTDDTFTAGGDLVGNDLSLSTTTWTSYTPTWGGIGTGTLSRNVGWYKKFGKIVHMEVYAVFALAGTGSSTVTVSLPSMPFRDGDGANTTRQMVLAHFSGADANGMGWGMVLAGGTTAIFDQLKGFDNTTLVGSNFPPATIVTIQGWYREA